MQVHIWTRVPTFAVVQEPFHTTLEAVQVFNVLGLEHVNSAERNQTDHGTDTQRYTIIACFELIVVETICLVLGDTCQLRSFEKSCF